MSDQAAKEALALPPPEVLQEIAARQDAKAREIAERRRKEQQKQFTDGNTSANQQDTAARLIQKNYRGYRQRRQLEGYGVDPDTRWMELLKEAKYFNTTRPMARRERSTGLSPLTSSETRDRWRRVGTIANRAGADDTSSSENEASEEVKRDRKREREKYAKVMGLEYFLEMVDQKHRYGSNLRRYHAEWKKADTNENFFYWLDHGEGKELDLEDRPRSRLDTEMVRYLSREERQKYLVRIDEEGRFCWAKNGQLITTSPEFKDSIDGIVPVDDETPTWREVTTGVKPESAVAGTLGSSSSSISSGISTGSQEDDSKYVNEEFHDAKGLNKLKHLNVDSLSNHMLRKTTKKNSWIFCCDTSFRLYIGIKQSGAFQHSSFLRGGRISAAGQIKAKRGQVRKLSPLSGHYAPPLRNFREFVKSLKSDGADLSRLNLGHSYAVLLGLEGYIEAKKHAKGAEQGVRDLFDPHGKKAREEAAKDKSQSAEKERKILEAQEREKRKTSLSHRFMRRLGFEDEKESPARDGKG